MRAMRPAIVVVNLLVFSCAWADPSQAHHSVTREPVVGLPCEGCDEVFEGMPATLESTARIAPRGAPGEPMRIEGVVRNGEGRPVSGVIVYAYHTDARGIYPRRDAGRHGQLRAWARSDSTGRYRFESIRPASYPGTTIPAHVHMHLIEPGRCTYYIDEILFDDDPHLTAAERSRQSGRGGSAIVKPRREQGVWLVTRDIILGERIPGYPAGK